MNAEIIAALNALLEEERATVDALVALVSMATDTFERQALTAMGGQAVQACIDLREDLERQEAPIGQRVSPSIGRILSPEHLDDRLRAFSALQQALANRCEQLQEAEFDHETRGLLARLRDVQLAHALWSERRAEEFAASRPEPDPALAPFMPNHSGPRTERPWTLPAPERRTHLTPRFAADYADQRTTTGDAAELAASDSASPAEPPADGSAPALPVPVPEQHPTPAASTTPAAEEATLAVLAVAPEILPDASAVSSVSSDVPDAGSPPPLPSAQTLTTTEQAEIAPLAQPIELPEAAALPGDEPTALATPLDSAGTIPLEDGSFTSPDAAPAQSDSAGRADNNTDSVNRADNGDTPKPAAKPRAGRTRTTTAKTRAKPRVASTD